MDKMMPFSPGTEEAVLGGLMLFPEEINETKLSASDFYLERYGKIFRAMQAVSDRDGTFDFVTLSVWLDERGELDEVGGPGKISVLINAAPVGLNVQYYANIVREKAARRKIIIAGQKAVQMAWDEKIPLDNVQASVEKDILEIGSAREEETSMRSLVADAFDLIEHPTDDMGDRVFFGIDAVDVGTFGIEDGRYWLAAAISGTGKSVVSVNLMRRMPAGSGIYYLSPEQGPKEVTYMALAAGTDSVIPLRVKLLHLKPEYRAEYAKRVMEGDIFLRNAVYGSGVTFEQLTRDITEDEIEQLRKSRTGLDDKEIWIEQPKGNIYQLRRAFRRKRAELNRISGRDAFLLIVIDGLGLIRKTEPGNTIASLMEISQNVKIAAQNDINPGAIIVNHHLNRSVFNGGNISYNLASLRDAPVENDADVIVIYNRQSVTRQDVVAGLWDDIEFIYLKNRQTSKTFNARSTMNTNTLRLEDGR